jgi:hypothetical protein
MNNHALREAEQDTKENLGGEYDSAMLELAKQGF